MRPLTIVYVTNRADPHFAWFCDAICNQVSAAGWFDTQMVFIDELVWANKVPIPDSDTSIMLADVRYHNLARRMELEAAVRGRFPFLHLPPKPHRMQGPFRLTKADWFCASNSRNTGFIAARHAYVVFCDDLSLPGPLWFSQAVHAAEHGYVVAGMYKKVLKLVVKDGLHVSHEDFPGGVDSRWEHGSDTGIVDWNGGALYGCSFGVPLDLALRIDGFEPACNGAGGEDFDFGIRLERDGAKIKLNRNLFTYESEEDHHVGGQAIKQRRLVSRDRLPAAYDDYQIPNQEEKYFSDHVLLNRLRSEIRTAPIMGEGLSAMRGEFMKSGRVPIPTDTADWRDGMALKDL